MAKHRSSFLTAADRLRRQIAQKEAKIQEWTRRLDTAADPRSRASLRAHITRARRDIKGLRARIRVLEARARRAR